MTVCTCITRWHSRLPRSLRNHIEYVQRVVFLLHDAWVAEKLKKWNFFTRTMDNLCHVIRTPELEIVDHMMDLIEDFEATNKHHQTLFVSRTMQLVCCSMLRFARILAPQSQKLTKTQPTHFDALSADELKAIHRLQAKLASSLINALPYAESRYTLEIDACHVQKEAFFYRSYPKKLSNLRGAGPSLWLKASRLTTKHHTNALL